MTPGPEGVAAPYREGARRLAGGGANPAGRPGATRRQGRPWLTGTAMRSTVLLLTALTGATLLVACGDDRPSGAAFCGRLAQEQGLVSSGVTNPAEIDAAVERYGELGRLAPAAIREPWQQLTALLQQAAALDPDDPDAPTELRQLAFESQSAADEVSDWARATCGIELRPATSLPPTGAASAAAVAPTEPASAPPPSG